MVKIDEYNMENIDSWKTVFEPKTGVTKEEKRVCQLIL